MNQRCIRYVISLLGFCIGCTYVALHPLGGMTLAEDVNLIAHAAEFRSPRTTGEARDRARLLYETIHGTLQVVHRDFFDDEDALAIPSRSLEDVFDELSGQYQVNLRWLVVNTDVLNVDHKPQNDFEKAAVASLASGSQFYERATEDRYAFAGAIRLKSQCLKCHVKRRTDTADRTAGLVIRMPVSRNPEATP